jgi:hypothetical protein
MALSRESPIVLERGAEIFTVDGQRLGTVDETRLDFFKVSAPMRKDYWLTTDCVAAAYPNRVTLQFSASELERHQRSDPGAPSTVGSTHGQQGYIPGASAEDANVHYDPAVSPDQQRRGNSPKFDEL